MATTQHFTFDFISFCCGVSSFQLDADTTSVSQRKQDNKNSQKVKSATLAFVSFPLNGYMRRMDNFNVNLNENKNDTSEIVSISRSLTNDDTHRFPRQLLNSTLAHSIFFPSPH